MRPVSALLALLFVAGFSASAQSPSAAALARKVDAHYNHLHSLQAHYAERYQGMGIDRTETGTLTLEKPGRMRWAYDSPAGKLFVLDGKNAISYTPGDAQATRFPEKKLDDLRSPLRLLLGHAQLEKELQDLSVTVVNLDQAEDRAGSRTGYTLWGRPAGGANGANGSPDQRIRALALTVDAAGIIHTLRIEETDGSVTTFTFAGMRENVPVAGTEFQFVPPPGVTVIDGEAPI